MYSSDEAVYELAKRGFAAVLMDGDSTLKELYVTALMFFTAPFPSAPFQNFKNPHQDRDCSVKNFQNFVQCLGGPDIAAFLNTSPDKEMIGIVLNTSIDGNVAQVALSLGKHTLFADPNDGFYSTNPTLEALLLEKWNGKADYDSKKVDAIFDRNSAMNGIRNFHPHFFSKKAVYVHNFAAMWNLKRFPMAYIRRRCLAWAEWFERKVRPRFHPESIFVVVGPSPSTVAMHYHINYPRAKELARIYADTFGKHGWHYLDRTTITMARYDSNDDSMHQNGGPLNIMELQVLLNIAINS
jgi:hypothetical protein